MTHSPPCLAACRRVQHLLIAAGVMICGLSACQSLGPKPPPLNTARISIQDLAQYPQLQQLKHWTVKGKISIRSAQASGRANLIWQQEHERFHITLSGPLGRGLTRIAGDEQGAVLTAAEHQYHAASAAALLQDYSGWQVPISAILWWARGLAQPDTEVQQIRLNREGQLQTLVQAGWHISFPSYQSVATQAHPAPLMLPSKITATQQDITITVLLKQWQL